VEVSGSTVTLTGTVGSLYQKRKAGNVAWNTPGIFNVNNELLVEYDYAAMAL
jgi:osmotically-inducible protein OsmY